MRIYNTICGPFATCTHSVRVVCDERLNRLYAVLRTHKQELDKCVPLDMKGVSATLQSGRYTLSYPRGRMVQEQMIRL